MNVVGNHQFLHDDAALVEPLLEIDGLVELDIAIVVAVNQQHG